MTNNLLIPNVGPIQNKAEIGSREKVEKAGAGPSFDKILKGELSSPASVPGNADLTKSDLKFSSHAMNRIRERSISMNKEQLAKLEKAVDTAAEKGAKESLVLTPEAAFIVSVKNKTVITVLDRNAMVGNVFTNIDSTVVV